MWITSSLSLHPHHRIKSTQSHISLPHRILGHPPQSNGAQSRSHTLILLLTTHQPPSPLGHHSLSFSSLIYEYGAIPSQTSPNNLSLSLYLIFTSTPEFSFAHSSSSSSSSSLLRVLSEAAQVLSFSQSFFFLFYLSCGGSGQLKPQIIFLSYFQERFNLWVISWCGSVQSLGFCCICELLLRLKCFFFWVLQALTCVDLLRFRKRKRYEQLQEPTKRLDQL